MIENWLLKYFSKLWYIYSKLSKKIIIIVESQIRHIDSIFKIVIFEITIKCEYYLELTLRNFLLIDDSLYWYYKEILP